MSVANKSLPVHGPPVIRNNRYVGINDIPVANTKGNVLLENWVEERSVRPIDPQLLEDGMTSEAQLFKFGHKGVLTTDFDAKASNVTEFRANYVKHGDFPYRSRGAKTDYLEKLLFEQIASEVKEEFNPPKQPVNYSSVTMEDYNIPGFVPTRIPPTEPHDYRNEQPCTFWTDHRATAQGVTQVKTLDTPFRKNANFSKPISEQWDEPKPYEHDRVPKM